ncbi:hypothetical protein WSM22_01690 [Cytophagales bacterium WSM2-2]|nr:hypothetical protein WSM22_01690 [Cytophagales bacterium WSM2-2]
MFFFLSKTLSYLARPLTVICVLFLVSAFTKRQRLKKRAFILGIIFLFFFSNEFIANEAIRLWEVPVTLMKDVNKTYTWGIILTGVTKHETGPPDRVYFQGGADRVTHTLQLYKMGKIKKILVSGGSGSLSDTERKEAHEVADALRLMGVPDTDIVMEAESRNTYESAVAIKKMLQGQSTPSECLLVTSAYHMRRSAACFKKVGWETDCFTVDFISHYRWFSIDALLIPKIEAMSIWQVLIKEWTGMVAYKLAGYI